MIYPHLRKILPPIVNPIIFEIGAHIGTDTVKIIKLLRPPYHYIAFEPDERDFPALIKIQQAHDFTLYPWAVGNIEGIVPFHLSDGTIKDKSGRQFTDGSSLKKPKGNVIKRPWIRFDKTVMVQCVKLDAFCRSEGIDHIDFIWADIQGAELEMIEGGREILKNTNYLYTECQEGMYHGQPGLRRILAALPGWEIVDESRTDVLLKNSRLA